MTDLKLSFDRETILELTEAQFLELSTKGETITDFAPAKDYWIEEAFSRLFLAFGESLSDYFFQFEPQEAIHALTKKSYLVDFFPKTGKLKLIKGFEKPLSDLLPGKRFEVTDPLQVEKSRFLEEKTTFSDPFIERSVEKLIRTGNLKEQISCCECGEAGCSSEYLWAEDNYGLASFHIIAAELRAVRLYPFKLV